MGGTDLGLLEYLSTSSHADSSVIASSGTFGGRMPTRGIWPENFRIFILLFRELGRASGITEDIKNNRTSRNAWRAGIWAIERSSQVPSHRPCQELALNVTVTTVIAGQVKPIRTIVEQP